MAYLAQSAQFFAKNRGATFISFIEDGIIGQNWGDKLNPYLLARLASDPSTPIVNAFGHANVFRRDIIVGIGSGLGHLYHRSSVVWGQGFAAYNSDLRTHPAQVRAVRGPLSLARLRQLGLTDECAIGDPALLLPRFVQVPRSTIHDVGLIPHISHRDCSEVRALRGRDGLKVIDITDGIEDVVKQISSCSLIASSSLHGLIAADAYGVPSTWWTLERDPIGDGFKFQDYFASVGHRGRQPLVLGAASTIQQLKDQQCAPRMDVDLNALLAACPLRDA